MNHHFHFRVVAIFAIMCGLFAGRVATAQENPVSVSFVAANCERKPTSFPFEGGECVPAEGAVIVVTDGIGNLIGTCQATAQSEEVASCTMQVPADTELVATLDPKSIDTDYLPQTEPQQFTAYADSMGVSGGPVFINLNRALECMGACPAKIVATAAPPPVGASALYIGAPTFEGSTGDIWELWVDGDSFWWQASGLEVVQKPSPRWVAAPVHSWLVVWIDMGTEDSWNTSEFPYDRFALQDGDGNVFLPDMVATSAFCAESCSRPIELQDYGMSVGVEFHEAIIFDAPKSQSIADDRGPQYALRTVDGLVEVHLSS